MGRPKGSGKKPVETAQEAVHGTENAPANEQKAPEIEEVKRSGLSEYSGPEVFIFDSWIYSETEPPIILKAGNPMPAGYSADRKSIKQFWVMDAQGKFTKG